MVCVKTGLSVVSINENLESSAWVRVVEEISMRGRKIRRMEITPAEFGGVKDITVATKSLNGKGIDVVENANGREKALRKEIRQILNVKGFRMKKVDNVRGYMEHLLNEGPVAGWKNEILTPCSFMVTKDSQSWTHGRVNE